LGILFSSFSIDAQTNVIYVALLSLLWWVFNNSISFFISQYPPILYVLLTYKIIFSCHIDSLRHLSYR
jgi:hypothetical protein